MTSEADVLQVGRGALFDIERQSETLGENVSEDDS